MKKLSLFPALILLVSLSATAQHIASSAVPSGVQDSFKKNFPGKEATWEMEGKDYEAGFKQQGRAMSALFNSDGALKETEKSIQRSELPAPVQAEITKRYKGKAVKEYAMITKADGEINYEAEVDGMDALFSKEGKFLKEAKD